LEAKRKRRGGGTDNAHRRLRTISYRGNEMVKVVLYLGMRKTRR
jgi:hypothetical protein